MSKEFLNNNHHPNVLKNQYKNKDLYFQKQMVRSLINKVHHHNK